jgi:hypothetical protein
VIGAWLLEHFIKNSQDPGRGASGVLAIYSSDKGVLLVLPLPRLALLLLLLEVSGGRVLGGILLPLSLGVGEDGSNCLLAHGKVGGDIQELASLVGDLRPNSWTSSLQVVPAMNAPMTSESVTLGSLMHCLEKH